MVNWIVDHDQMTSAGGDRAIKKRLPYVMRIGQWPISPDISIEHKEWLWLLGIVTR
jgi:hypothetical protein